MMIVLVNAYAGCMTALMTLTKLEPIAVNSLEELANSNKIKLTVAKNTVPANIFLVILNISRNTLRKIILKLNIFLIC